MAPPLLQVLLHTCSLLPYQIVHSCSTKSRLHFLVTCASVDSCQHCKPNSCVHEHISAMKEPSCCHLIRLKRHLKGSSVTRLWQCESKMMEMLSSYPSFDLWKEAWRHWEECTDLGGRSQWANVWSRNNLDAHLSVKGYKVKCHILPCIKGKRVTVYSSCDQFE